MKDLIKEKVLETKKSLVLQKVSELFDEKGFDSLKMQDIASSIGISVGALYKLFPSKDRLFFEYIAYQIKLFYDELTMVCKGVEEPEELLKRYVALKFATFASKRKALEDPIIGDPLFFVKMNTQKSDPAEPIYGFLAETFKKLHAKKPLKVRDHLKTAYLFNAYTMGFIEFWIKAGDSLDDDASEVVDNFLSGMRRG